MISHIFRKIIPIPLTIGCTTLDERQVLLPEYTAWEHFKRLYRHSPDCFHPGRPPKISPSSSIRPPASANRIDQTFCK